MPCTTAATTTNGATVLSRALERYFSDPRKFTILHLLTTASDQKRTISLRLIEWYVTDYSRYVIPNATTVAEYADNLNIYTRKMFDPFRRGKQQRLRCGDVEVQTTVGQMNFFRWFIESGLWDDVNRRASDLLAQMSTHPEKKAKQSASQVSKTVAEKVAGTPGPLQPYQFSTLLDFD